MNKELRAMDWTTFGNIVNVLAGLVTIGAPTFSVLRIVARNRQRSVVPDHPTQPRPQGRTPLNRNSQPNAIPWYLWVKVIFYTCINMVIEQPVIIFFYPLGGITLVGAVFLFCILVGIPVGWLNESSVGTRVFLLCTLLVVSLHFSVEFAEHSDEFLQKLRKRRKSL